MKFFKVVLVSAVLAIGAGSAGCVAWDAGRDVTVESVQDVQVVSAGTIMGTAVAVEQQREAGLISNELALAWKGKLQKALDHVKVADIAAAYKELSTDELLLKLYKETADNE
jgi:hypothetical protein